MEAADLKDIIEKHEEWVKSDYESGRRAVLYGMDLRGVDFSCRDMREADLSFCNLSNALFYNSNLRGADLRKSDLSDAIMCGADIAGADIFEAKMPFFKETFMHIDENQATKMLENLLENIKYSRNISQIFKDSCSALPPTK